MPENHECAAKIPITFCVSTVKFYEMQNDYNSSTGIFSRSRVKKWTNAWECKLTHLF